MTRGRRAILDPVVVAPDVGALPVDGRITVPFPDDRAGWFDPSTWACTPLRRELSAEIVWQCRPGGRIASPATLSMYARACRAFLAYLADTREDHGGLSLAALRGRDIDGFEAAQAQRAERTQAYARVTTVVALLRDAGDRHDLAPELVHRLSYATSIPRPRARPRDAYSHGETAAIREACRRDIVTIVARLTRSDDDLWGGVPDRTDEGSWTRTHLLKLAAAKGPLDETGLRSLIGWGARGERRAQQINAEIYPTIRDLVPFFVLLCLDTGLEPEAVRQLEIDCLANRSGGRMDLRFMKRRRRGHEQGVLRVADHGLFSPGSLVRLVLAITERTRRHFPSRRLWIHYQMGRFHQTPFVRRRMPDACPFQLWVRDHGLVDDDGEALRLLPVRLRKTRMAERYRASHGQLDDFRLNHSRDVAVNHYANIPALREIHELTIAEGLADALAAAIDPPKVLADDPSPVPPGIDPRTSHQLLAGELDVWVSACTGFLSSPFGEDGAPCPTPVWGCLACENAVFTTNRLPSVIKLLDHIEAQRASLDDDTWSAVFGAAHDRIIGQVLPAFPDAVVTSARKAAIAGHGEIPAALLGTTT
jgi:hypothetical protein